MSFERFKLGWPYARYAYWLGYGVVLSSLAFSKALSQFNLFEPWPDSLSERSDC